MKFDKEFFHIGYLDRISQKDTFIHRIDARVKVIVSLLFVITVVSFPKYEISRMMPFFLFPVLFLSLGDIPVRFVLVRLLIVSPFILFIAIFNPLLERNIAFYFFSIPVSYGFLSLLSIFLRFVLTVSILILLIATTSFSGVCYALRAFRLPNVFINQLLFLYRYIFVLTEEAMRMVRAKELRSFNGRGQEIKFYVRLVGNLLLRTIERAERIYYAMLSRGYNGIMPYRKISLLGYKDYLFMFFSVLLLYIFRFYDPTEWIKMLF